MIFSSRVARRGRDKPRRSRFTIVVESTCWKIIKVAGDEQSNEERVFKIQAEAWLTEKDVSALRDVIATPRGKQSRIRRKGKSICEENKRSAREKRKERQAST